MSTSTDLNDATVQAAKNRRAEAEQRKAAEALACKQAEFLRFERLNTWGSVHHTQSVAWMILDTVTRFGNELVQRGTTILFRFPAQAVKRSVYFELHHADYVMTLDRLLFPMDDAGIVTASLSEQRPNHLAQVMVGRATETWAKEIAFQAWKVVMEAHGG